MRLSAVLLVIGLASICKGQPSALPPVPDDAHELVTGRGRSLAHDAARSDALTLLNRAKSFLRLHAPNTPPHLLTVEFTTDSGPGELTELWLGQRGQRWTAKFGDYSPVRYLIHGETFDEKHVGLAPMRVHMLRNTIFWAAGTIAADAHFRAAPALWNGKPVTCVLVSDRGASPADASAGRQWDESEYCIEDGSGLIQILSFAPGNYSVYSYANGQTYHGMPIPDRIATYNAGKLVIDASLRLDEPDGSSLPATPTQEMIANGPVIGLQDPLRRRMDVPDTRVIADEPVMVNAQIGPTGEVADAEICASSDTSLNSDALAFVKGMHLGRRDFQRQEYIELVYTPRVHSVSGAKTASKPLAPRVPVESFYLERAMAGSNGAPFHDAEKEIIARRFDGSIARLASVGPVANGVFSREIDFIDGRHITVYDSIHAKVTWPVRSDMEMQYQRDHATTGPGECDIGQSTPLRREQMEGVDVDVIQTGAGANRVTLWSAPRLGCEYLRDKAEAPNRDGSFRVALDVKTTKLVLGEPDPQLFEVGSGLIEMRPSEALRKLWGTLDLPVGEGERAAILREIERQGAELDKRYRPKGQ